MKNIPRCPGRARRVLQLKMENASHQVMAPAKKALAKPVTLDSFVAILTYILNPREE